MSNYDATRDGSILKIKRIEATSDQLYCIDEKQFENWQRKWDSKEAVIDHLLDELEMSMTKSSQCDQSFSQLAE